MNEINCTRLVKTSYLYVPKREIPEFQVSLLKDILSVRSRFDSAAEMIEMFDDSKPGWFGIPLHHNIKIKAEQVIDQRVMGEKLSFLFKPTFKLRPGQVPVLRKFEEGLSLGKTGFVLEAKPGFGKTISVIKMIHTIAKTTLVVVPRSNLVKQWMERLTEHTFLTEQDIGIVNGPEVRWRNKKIVIGLVHSLALNKNGDDFRKSFGLVVFDEVDRSVPPATFAPVVPMFPSKYRIGCSATIERKDGLDVVFDKHIGEVHIQGVAGKGEIMKPTVIMVNYNKGSGAPPPSRIPRMNRRGILFSKIAKDPFRNALLALYIRKVYISGRRLVVLSDRVRHLQLLRELSCKKYGIPLSDTGLYVGSVPSGKGKFAKRKKIPEHEMQRVGRDCKIIFATYQMFGIGTDTPTMAALIYATPQSEVVQTKGRIERSADGKQEPVVIDVYDAFYEETRRWAAERLRQYRADGMQIKRLK